jgi:hypothetical protein
VSPSIKHYEPARWLQFVRGELNPEQSAKMQRHLDSPCRKCSETLDMLRKIEATARADADINVPETAVRMARAIYALEKPAQVKLSARIIARMVFDSFLEPAAAGVRSTRHLARQTLYEAGDYTIDLRLEPDADSTQVVMVGQIANRVDPEIPVGALPILLKGGKKELGRAVTNQFGEFQLVYRPTMPLRLLIPVPPGAAQLEIEVPRKPSKG